jgi:hypothetical protein
VFRRLCLPFSIPLLHGSFGPDEITPILLTCGFRGRNNHHHSDLQDRMEFAWPRPHRGQGDLRLLGHDQSNERRGQTVGSPSQETYGTSNCKGYVPSVPCRPLAGRLRNKTAPTVQYPAVTSLSKILLDVAHPRMVRRRDSWHQRISSTC